MPKVQVPGKFDNLHSSFDIPIATLQSTQSAEYPWEVA